jgi:ATP-dependent protease Clp ATPase subunit
MVEKTEIAPKVSCNCSLCDRKQNEVSVMITSRGIFICDMCVQLCVDIINERKYAENNNLK